MAEARGGSGAVAKLIFSLRAPSPPARQIDLVLFSTAAKANELSKLYETSVQSIERLALYRQECARKVNRAQFPDLSGFFRPIAGHANAQSPATAFVRRCATRTCDVDG